MLEVVKLFISLQNDKKKEMSEKRSVLGNEKKNGKENGKNRKKSAKEKKKQLEPWLILPTHQTLKEVIINMKV